MLLALAVLLLVVWMLGLVAFKVTSAVIHVVAFVALLALVAHFLRRRAGSLD